MTADDPHFDEEYVGVSETSGSVHESDEELSESASRKEKEGNRYYGSGKPTRDVRRAWIIRDRS